MCVIKRTDSGKYQSEWEWMENPWDGRKYSQEEAEAGVAFFRTLDIPCEIEILFQKFDWKLFKRELLGEAF